MEIIRPLKYAQILGTHLRVDKTIRDIDVYCSVLKTMYELAGTSFNVPDTTGVEPRKIRDYTHMSKICTRVKSLFEEQPKGSTSLVLSGHSGTDIVKERTGYLLKIIEAKGLRPDLIIFERGAPYTVHNEHIPVIRESDLTTWEKGDFGAGMTVAQRDLVVCGYLVLVVGSGNWEDVSRFLLFLDETRHERIFFFFEYFSKNTLAHVRKKFRILFSICSTENGEETGKSEKHYLNHFTSFTPTMKEWLTTINYN